MQTKVQKWGNSLALRIPKSFALNIDIKQNEFVDLSIGDGKLIITPITEKAYSLKELLAGVSKDNLHEEFDTGIPVGKEFL
jgi:antitoxin MazE